VIKGEKIICVAATEPTGGSVLASLGTEAVTDDEG
jgi:alkylation response protein AidB-like acyl-CoA dehydrogenase